MSAFVAALPIVSIDTPAKLPASARPDNSPYVIPSRRASLLVLSITSLSAPAIDRKLRAADETPDAIEPNSWAPLIAVSLVSPPRRPATSFWSFLNDD